MTTTEPSIPLADVAAATSASTSHRFAVLRIIFGVVWCIDAAYKWVPAFRTQTLVSQFDHHLTQVHTPVIHGWINLWFHVAEHHQNPFGYAVACMETAIAFCVLTGCFSRAVFVVGAFFSAGIWTAAEGMGLPIQAGQTDIGTSCIYVLVFVALFMGQAGHSWSLDARFRGRGGVVDKLRN